MIKRVCLAIVVLILVFLTFMPAKKQNENAVVFWTLQLNTFEPYIRQVIDEFETQNPDIKIEWIDVPYSEGEKRVLASLLSDNIPDLINITSDFAITLAGKNALTVFDENDVKDYSAQIMKTLKKDDKYIALPFYATSAITFYNKKLLSDAGIKRIPETYDELNDISPDFYKKTQRHAQMPTLCENDTFLKILNKYGIREYTAFKSKETEKIYAQYKFLYANNFLPKESITQTHREVLEKYGAGQIAFLQAGSNFLNIIKENSPQVYSQTDVAPQMKTKDSGYDFSLMTLAIPKKAKNQEAAKAFAQFLISRDNQLDFAKLTSILPVNQDTLNDDYFKNSDENDLIAKARKISASQLNNLQTPIYFKKNQKEIQNAINNSTQTILLDKNSIENELSKTAKLWAELEN